MTHFKIIVIVKALPLIMFHSFADVSRVMLLQPQVAKQVFLVESNFFTSRFGNHFMLHESELQVCHLSVNAKSKSVSHTAEGMQVTSRCHTSEVASLNMSNPLHNFGLNNREKRRFFLFFFSKLVIEIALNSH